jgi:hypothetical protein
MFASPLGLVFASFHYSHYWNKPNGIRLVYYYASYASENTNLTPGQGKKRMENLKKLKNIHFII